MEVVAGTPKPFPILALEARIRRELREHLRQLGFQGQNNGLLAPADTTKETLRELHRGQRAERLSKQRTFIRSAWKDLSVYFANGSDVDIGRIAPRLELIEAKTWQSELFRLASLTWSIPVSQGYGRRMRYLVWDDNCGKVIGLIALTDPVFNLKARDEYIGWSGSDRKARLANVMDAYVLGALPPYNQILGGKLVASLLTTTQVRDDFRHRYAGIEGLISGKRKRASLVLVTTSSALGRSSVYNRLRLGDRQIFRPVGYTSGWGHFHISDRLFASIRQYLTAMGHKYATNYKFGDGPNWRMRAVREALVQVGLDPHLLRHGIERQVFVAELATNAKSFLCGRARSARYDLPSITEVAEQAKARWLVPRAARSPRIHEWRRDDLLPLLEDAPYRLGIVETTDRMTQRTAHGAR